MDVLAWFLITDIVLGMVWFNYFSNGLGLQGIEGTNGCTTGGGSFLLAMTVNLSYDSILGDAHMRSIEKDDVAVFGDVVAESVPSGHAGEGEASKATEREDFAPAVLHEIGDIFFVVVVVKLVRARTLCEDGVLFGDAELGDLLVDHLLNDTAGESSGEMSTNR